MQTKPALFLAQLAGIYVNFVFISWRGRSFNHKQTHETPVVYLWPLLKALSWNVNHHHQNAMLSRAQQGTLLFGLISVFWTKQCFNNNTKIALCCCCFLTIDQGDYLLFEFENFLIAIAALAIFYRSKSAQNEIWILSQQCASICQDICKAYLLSILTRNCLEKSRALALSFAFIKSFAVRIWFIYQSRLRTLEFQTTKWIRFKRIRSICLHILLLL